jgi:hypothetical protein
MSDKSLANPNSEYALLHDNPCRKNKKASLRVQDRLVVAGRRLTPDFPVI